MSPPLSLGLMVTVISTMLQFTLSQTMPFLTKAEYGEYRAFLEKEVVAKYPADDQDPSEVVHQVSVERVVGGLGVTLYKPSSGNVSVFVEVGINNVGKPVITLLRGEDYIDPMNKERFVVLRKRGTGNDYNVHLAVIWRDTNDKMYVVWEDVTIHMVANMDKVLEYIFEPSDLVERNQRGGLRTPCGWFGSVLMCESKSTPSESLLKPVANAPPQPPPPPPTGSKLPSGPPPTGPKPPPGPSPTGPKPSPGPSSTDSKPDVESSESSDELRYFLPKGENGIAKGTLARFPNSNPQQK